MHFEFWIFVIATTLLLLELFFYVYFYSRIFFIKPKSSNKKLPGVSIIIAARNEEDNLCKHLPLWLEQKYEEFEIIVINDCSSDGTSEVVRAYMKENENVRLIELHESNMFSGGKKYAVTLGVKGAIYEHVLCTDADCYPESDLWINQMMQGFEESNEIVLGYGAYEKQGGILNRIIRMDTAMIALQYITFAKAGVPYMGVGRNLAYKKDLFFKNKGFASHYSLKSGDDDLFINEAAKSGKVNVVIQKNSKTISLPERTFKDWFNQKSRHLTTANRYKFSHKLLLTLLQFSKYGFILFSIIIMFQGQFLLEILLLWLIRFLVQFVILRKCFYIFGERDLVYLFPFLEILLVVIYPGFLLKKLSFSDNKWKT